MRKFEDYVQLRNKFELASALVEHEIDVDAWVQNFRDVAGSVQLSEAEIYNELRAGLMNLAAKGLGGAAGLAGRGIAAGAGAVGRAGMAGLNAAGNVARAGAGVVGRAGGAVANYGKAGLQAAGQGLQTAGQGIANTYAQGEQAHKINQAMKGIDNLSRQLNTMGVGDPKVIDQHLGNLRTQLQQMGQFNKGTSGARFGQGAMSLGGNPAMGMA